MQTEPVASGPRGKDVLRRNPCRGLTLATALAVSTLWMLATEARSQQIVADDIVVSGTIGTQTLIAAQRLESFGETNLYGTTTIGSVPAHTLNVGATTTFDAPVTMNGPLTTNGPLTANGQATLGSLEVTGDAEFNGNLSVDGDLNMVGGDIMNVGTLGAGTVNAGTLDASSTTTGTLTTTGKATLGSLEVTGDANFNGNLIVDGAVDMVGGDIVNVGTLDASTINAGTLDANSISTNSLTASVATASVGHITNLNTSTIVNSGNITTDTLTTTGKASLDSLEVVNDAEVKGSLTVANGATVSKSFTVAPGSTVDMGGNRVENVGDPIALTDAANKGYVDAGLARAFRDIDRNTEGVALAMAMAGTPTLLPMENFALAANWGQFEGAHGLAAGFAVRLDQNLQLNGGIAYGPNENTVGTRAGVRIGW